MKSKQDKALDLLESIGQADERLVQHALHVDNPEKFMLLSQGSAVKRWGTLAACLALVLALAAFPWLLSKLPASIPATQPPQTTTTQPTQPTTADPTAPTNPADPTDPSIPNNNYPETYDPTKPPALMLYNNAVALQPYITGYDWHCIQESNDPENRWNKLELSSPFINPLSAELDGHIPWVTSEESTLTLKFLEDYDSIHVRCWPEASFGDPDAYETYETATVIASSFALNAGRYIYEVTAKWYNAYPANGNVTYVFGVHCTYTIISPETDIQFLIGDTVCEFPAGGLESGTRYDDVGRKWISMVGIDGYWLMRDSVMHGLPLPTLTLTEDLDIQLGANGTLESIMVYYKASETQPGLYMVTQDPARLSSLPPDQWCILINVTWLGRYIEQEGQYETYTYAYVFNLQVPEPAIPPYLWDFDASTGTLTISGCEILPDFTADGRWSSAPWRELRSDIRHVIIADGIKKIGTYAFCNMPNLLKVTLPNSLEEIGDYAFQNATTLAKISLPASLKKIGNGCFFKCEDLPEIILPEGLQHIGDDAFQFCESLKTLTIPSSVTSIGLNVFWYCSSLKEANILCSLQSLFRPFVFCNSLRILRFCGNAPDTLENLDHENTVLCFYPAGNSTWTDEILDTAYLSHGVWFASKDPLSEHPTENDISGYCGRTAHWSIKDDVLTISGIGEVTYVGWTKFKNQITQVMIQDGITNIPSQSFYQCVNLTSVTIPQSVTFIGAGAFENCKKLAAVTLPTNLKEMGQHTFWGCTSLTKIVIPDSMTVIPHGAFYNCTSLKYVTFSSELTEVGGIAFANCVAITELHFPATLKVLGDSAFAGCTALRSIYFYKDVPQVSNFTFKDVTATAYYPPGNLSWISDGLAFHSGLIFEVPDPNQPPQGCLTHDFGDWVRTKDPTPLSLGEEKQTCKACGFFETRLVQYVHYEGEKPDHAELGEPIDSGKGYQIQWALYPDGTLTIFGTRTMEGAYSYPWHKYADQITRVIVDEGLAKIASRAFSELPNLKTVILPSTIMKIEKEAFKSCHKLESLVIPAKVTDIGNSAFAFCRSLKTVYFLGNAPKMEENIFYNNNLTVYYPAGNQTWTKDVLQAYGGTVNWVAGEPSAYTPLYYKKKDD